MRTYDSTPEAGGRDRITVGVSNYVVAEEGETLVAYGLGACLAVALWDPEAGVGALCHAMLPEQPSDGGAEGKYVDSAVQSMLREMVSRGAGYTAVEARIAGGADVFAFADIADEAGEAGARNVAAARRALEALGIETVAADVGGSRGRTVTFDTADGSVTVVTATGEETHL